MESQGVRLGDWIWMIPRSTWKKILIAVTPIMTVTLITTEDSLRPKSRFGKVSDLYTSTTNTFGIQPYFPRLTWNLSFGIT